MQEKNQGWNVVKEDERYVVTDNNILNNLVASTTYLNPSKNTSTEFYGKRPRRQKPLV